MYTSGHVTQSLSLGVYQPSTVWKNDIILRTPQLVSPLDGSKLCPPPSGTGSANSNIILDWLDVPGATAYILQWCLNGNFSGPTVQSKRVASSAYHMQLLTDIRIGDEIHWRVMAIDGTGGISEKSESRTFKYECDERDASGEGDAKRGGSGTGFKGKLCKDYAINMKIVGPKETMCCDRVIFKLQASWDCKDAFNREVMTLTSVNWVIVQNPDDAANSIESSNDRQATVLCACEQSQLVTIRATGSFYDAVLAETVFCSAEHQFFVDCDTGLPEYKPYLQVYPLYDGAGMQHYTHPDYYRDSIAFTPYMRTPYSVSGLPVLSGGDLVGNVQDAGEPLGNITVTRAAAMGPVVRTAFELFPAATQDPAAPKCNRYISAGNPTGEVMEANVHQAFGCGLTVHENSVVVNNEHLSGSEGNRKGLKPYGLCSLQVDPGCGIKIANQQVAIDTDVLAGDGIYVTDTCTLNTEQLPWVRFKTMSAISDRVVLAEVDLHSVGARNTALGTLLTSGEVISVHDVQNMWPEITADCWGTAFYRPQIDADPEADPPVAFQAARWEIETCSLVANEITVELDSILKSTQATGTAKILPYPVKRSTYNDTMPIADEQASWVTFQNPWKLDAICGSKAVLRRICPQVTFAEPDNETAGAATPDLTPQWEVVLVEKRKARHILITVPEGSAEPVVNAWYDGEDPASCSATVNIAYPLGKYCLEGKQALAFYDPNTDIYQVDRTASGMLGPPEEKSIPFNLTSVTSSGAPFTNGASWDETDFYTFPKCGAPVNNDGMLVPFEEVELGTCIYVAGNSLYLSRSTMFVLSVGTDAAACEVAGTVCDEYVY